MAQVNLNILAGVIENTFLSALTIPVMSAIYPWLWL